MKKVLIALFVLGIALPSFAGINVKDVVGTWSYELVMEYETISGTLKFEKDGKELTGEVLTDEGQTIPMNKVEIRDNDVLYFSLDVDYNLMEVSMSIDGKKYTGTVASNGGEVPVTGKKVE